MKIGITTYALECSRQADPGAWGPLAMAQWAVGAGAEVIQICENSPITALDEDGLNRLLDLPIQVETGLRGLRPEDHRLHVELASRTGAALVRTVIDDRGFEPTPSEVLVMMKELRPLYEGAGVILAIENHDRFPSPLLAKMMEEAGPWAGVCFDTGNSLCVPESPGESLSHLAHLAASIHVKDIAIRRVHDMMGFTIQGQPAGDGIVELEPLVALAKERSVNLLVEQWPPQPRPDGLPEWEQGAVRKGLAKLRQLARS